MIYAWDENDPLPGQDIEYHKQNRGSAQIQLLNRMEINQETPWEILEFNIESIVLPPTKTFYYCKSFEIPESSEKQHIVKVRVEEIFFP